MRSHCACDVRYSAGHFPNQIIDLITDGVGQTGTHEHGVVISLQYQILEVDANYTKIERVLVQNIHHQLLLIVPESCTLDRQ